MLIVFNNVINSDHQTDVLYLNFHEVFDSVPHNELLLNLVLMGISGNLWLWFKFYHLNCQQYVKSNNQYSDMLPVLTGISQSSILGLLLFQIYFNNLLECVLFSTLTDDTKCLKTITNVTDHLEYFSYSGHHIIPDFI